MVKHYIKKFVDYNEPIIQEKSENYCVKITDNIVWCIGWCHGTLIGCVIGCCDNKVNDYGIIEALVDGMFFGFEEGEEIVHQH